MRDTARCEGRTGWVDAVRGGSCRSWKDPVHARKQSGRESRDHRGADGTEQMGLRLEHSEMWVN